MTSQWSLIFVIALILLSKAIGFSSDSLIKSVGYGGPAVSLDQDKVFLNNGSSFFSLSLSSIKNLNQEPLIFFNEAMAVGEAVFADLEIKNKNLESSQLDFVLPARGWNWGILHDFNAVDIAAACGNSVYAAEEGLVVEVISDNSWNNGYGNYIVIEHPKNIKTRYAHTLKNLVKVGDYVLKGQQIALIGNSGNTHGASGCHLHFEVYGAKNPFAIR